MTAVRIERVIPAPPARVYRAWLDPATLAHWSAPVGFEVARHEVDERVGGYYRCWHVDAQGRELGGYDAEILELVPNERIVLRWRFVGPGRAFDEGTESQLTITLAPTAEGAARPALLAQRRRNATRAAPPDAPPLSPRWRTALAPPNPGMSDVLWRPNRVSRACPQSRERFRACFCYGRRG